VKRASACTLTVVAVTGVVLTGTTGAVAATVTPSTVVSGPSPFASCSAGAGPGAVNYVNAEVEPQVAIDPADPKVLIGGWQQDRWNDGGAHGLVAGYSADGGATWRTTPLPFSACARGGVAYTRASDPWVSIGPDGTAYAVSISFDETDNNNAVVAATSANGGRTWQNVRTVIADDQPNFQFFNDKESVTADPARPGVAYVVWDRLAEPTSNPRASQRTAAYTGPAMFAKTTDGGLTWSAPQVIVNTGQHRQTIGNQVVVDPRSGILYDFFDLLTPPFGVSAANVAFVSSSDGGATWSAPHVIASLQTAGVTDPNTGQEIRTGDIIPEAAIDPATGRLYAVWQDSRWSGGSYDEVALSTSPDGGGSWTAPVRVNRPTGRAAFNPAVAVSSNGTVGVTYDDLRALTTQTATLPTDYWLTTSTNSGATFAGETHLAGSFDLLTAPNAEGYFLGDYQGLVASGTRFQSFYVAANSGNTANRTSVFATTVTP
jgi:Neuraminidase (sialidase)